MFNHYLHRHPDYASQPKITDAELMKQRTINLLGTSEGSPERQAIVNEIVLSLMRSTFGVVISFNVYDDEYFSSALLILQESVNDLPNTLKRLMGQGNQEQGNQEQGNQEQGNQEQGNQEQGNQEQGNHEQGKFNLQDFNLSYYILGLVKKKMCDVCRKRNIVSMSLSTMRRRDKKGVPRYIRRSLEDLTKSSLDFEEVDQVDFLEHIVRDKRQRSILELKIQGYNIKEIAEILNLGSGTVFRDLDDFRWRLEEAL